LRLQPALEVLNANLMLNLGMPDDNGNRRLAVAYVVDPIICTKNRRPWAIASFSESAVTSTVCTQPRRSVQEILQVRTPITLERITFVFSSPAT
jgi:hypothetical protein